ncbi:hypothetical protein [Halarcobacter sp.]|uniref:hypothetical protein n=1 Tax=Halarcobacter sp. TaxID=2321133 RepID=UPI002AA7AEFD|nr:hypothetical protein [Halarcobacter sp.]
MNEKKLSYRWWKIYSYIFTVLNIIWYPFFWMGFFATKEYGYSLGFFIAVGLTIGILLTLLVNSLSLGKKSFLTITILSFNPIIWIINGIYLKNRWSDISNI